MNDDMIGIVGLGIMGCEIADACLQSGYHIVVFDGQRPAVDAFLADRPNLSDRINAPETLRGFSGCGLIVEAIVEALEPKLEIFGELEHVAPEAILVSNSSTFMPTELAPAVDDASRLLVCHFFNPATTVPLVEIVPGGQTSAQAVDRVERWAVRIGKTPVRLRREVAGFIANRLQAAMLRECCALVDAGVASPEEIDTAVKLSLAPRWSVSGPLETADLGGLDTFAALTARLLPDLDDSVETPRLIAVHAEAGQLGAKTGKGIYDWTDERRVVVQAQIAESFDFLRDHLGRVERSARAGKQTN